MNEEEKVKIKLNIAGEAFRLAVPYSQQEETRHIEEEVNSLFDLWRTRFPEKNDRELLAMIAFRYAERFAALMRERGQAREELETLQRKLEMIVGQEST